MTELPFVDRHDVLVPVRRGMVWTALETYAAAHLRLGPRSLVARILDTKPRAGFQAAERRRCRRLTLAGRHRFSTYRLTFTLTDHGDATHVSAVTEATFPGLHGALYRFLVISTGAHSLVTRRILQAIRTASLSLSRATAGNGPPPT